MIIEHVYMLAKDVMVEFREGVDDGEHLLFNLIVPYFGIGQRSRSICNGPVVLEEYGSEACATCLALYFYWLTHVIVDQRRCGTAQLFELVEACLLLSFPAELGVCL